LAADEGSDFAARVVIAVGGDVLPESSWKTATPSELLLQAMREEFARADLVFVNLEQPITRSARQTPYKNPADVAAGRDYILRATNAEIPRHLKEAGVGLVGLANNHMMDYLAAGLRDTLQALRRAHLPFVGAGVKEDAERPFVFEKNGVRVALLSFSDVVPRNAGATETALGIASSKKDADLVNAIRRARRQADFVVLMIHWGGQGNHLITPRQRRLAAAAAEAGAAVIVGMHPHVLQGAEYFGPVPVLYSIGNFVFPSSRPAARESVLAKLTFRRDGLDQVEVVPVEIRADGAPQVAAGERAEEILDHLDGFCRMFNVRVKNGKLERAAPRAPLVYDQESGGRTHGRAGESRSPRSKRQRGKEL
jgi:poly-gamma-glutamate synthesis protein (capsule biosynthesis protein)